MGKQNYGQAPLPIVSKCLYTIQEAAIYLGRTGWSVRELIWGGALPSVKVGRRVHLDFNDLNQFIDRYKVIEPGQPCHAEDLD
ncbi:MAG: excisionase family DNA-binding protein [Nitrospiraceae bacterium]